MAKGEAIGCFGLTEPDFGFDPAGMRTRARRDGRAGCWTARRRGSPTARSSTSRWCGNVPTLVSRASSSRQTRPGSRPTRSRASSLCGHLSPLSWSCREVGFLGRPCCLACSLCAGGCRAWTRRVSASFRSRGLRPATVWRSPWSISAARGVQTADRGLAVDPAEAGRYDTRAPEGLPAVDCLSAAQGGRKTGPRQISLGKFNNARETIAIARQSRTILGANCITLSTRLRHANDLEAGADLRRHLRDAHASHWSGTHRLERFRLSATGVSPPPPGGCASGPSRFSSGREISSGPGTQSSPEPSQT